MNQDNQIQLNPSCILNVPFQTYRNDFSFIVNGENFQTSRLISDLLSPIISQIHISDPTINTYTINTSQKGNFSHFLKLFNFKPNYITEGEVPFILEVIEKLGTESIEFKGTNKTTEITNENVFELIKQHEKHPKFYSNRFSLEIEFISSQFFDLSETKEEEFESISTDTLLLILRSDKLQIDNEDQLLTFVNKLYSKSSMYSILYETVLFEYASVGAISEFLSIFNSDDMGRGTWLSLSKRLQKELRIECECEKESRYRVNTFAPSEGSVFDGILNFLRKKSNNQIEQEVSITASSCSSSSYDPKYVVLFEDKDKNFHSDNFLNSWLCFDFRKHRVIPAGYKIKSYPNGPGTNHPKNWVIEGSSDNSSWETLDEERDCAYLNGNCFVHTFKINQPKSKAFCYIRMRIIDKNWANYYCLRLNSFEIYGKLI